MAKLSLIKDMNQVSWSLQFKKKGFIDMITMHSVYLPAVEVERKRWNTFSLCGLIGPTQWPKPPIHYNLSRGLHGHHYAFVFFPTFVGVNKKMFKNLAQFFLKIKNLKIWLFGPSQQGKGKKGCSRYCLSFL